MFSSEFIPGYLAVVAFAFSFAFALGLSHHAEYLRMYQMQIACQSSWHALLEY
jgi:hypothetical protein